MNIDCCKSYVGKQIIGLLPNEEECLYYLVINGQDLAAVNWTGWLIDGVDVYTSGYYFYNNSYGNQSLIVSYIGTQSTQVVLDDGFGNLYPFTVEKVTNYGGSCEKVCYQAEFDYGYNLYYIDYFQLGGATPTAFAPINIDSEALLEGYINPLLGTTNADVSSVWDGSRYVVTINNAYNLGGLTFDDGLGNLVTFNVLPCEITPPTPVPLSLLTAYPGATSGYSVRKLSTTYTGAALRVRRSSDNTESDIGFDSNGNLDETALTTFVGAGNGFVTKWYDQTGNTRTAQQTTAIFQCKIVNAGVIIKENTIPSIEFVNNSIFGQIKLPIINLTTQLDSSFFITSVVKANTQATYKGIFATQTSGSNGVMMLSRGGSNNWGTYGGGAYQPSNSNIQAQPLTLITMQSSNGNSGNFYKNSSADGTFANTEGQTYVGIGGQPSQEFGGKISELILYPTDQSANRVGIETDIKNYYGI